PVLNKLSSRSQEDVYSIINIAETGTREGVDFAGTYSGEEVSEMVSVTEKMIIVRDVILKVNQEYIYSAGQADEYRTEPAFKLQGSYRNMNRICEKIVPIMNEDELKTVLLSHYENEAQTLTTGAEANMLKFRELTGWMSKEEKTRWEDIKKTFKKNQLLRGADASDPVTRVVAQLSTFQDGLESIREVLAQNLELETRNSDNTVTRVSFNDETLSKLEKLGGS
ncbi:MAG: AAA family ATPase, partial [Desulfobacteraceae bacterium]|nr:AAA family ATPase [Desulfobacteraceae bacterium]